jgi:hypothetical protein
LKAWLIENPQNYTPEDPQGVHSFIDEENVLMNKKGTIVSNKDSSELNKSKNLTELLQFCWHDAARRSSFNLKKIAIFLPYKLIDGYIKPVDQYPKDKNGSKLFEIPPLPLGKECEVTVRFSERLKPSDRSNTSKEKWRSLTRRERQPVIEIFHPLATSGNSNEFFRQIFAEDVVAVKLTEVLPSETKKRTFIMMAFHDAGIPVALWMRPEAENLNCAEELQNICNACNSWSDLPKVIKQKRSEAWEQGLDTHIGNHLSLLWDDPDIVPPVTVKKLEMLES